MKPTEMFPSLVVGRRTPVTFSFLSPQGCLGEEIVLYILKPSPWANRTLPVRRLLYVSSCNSLLHRIYSLLPLEGKMTALSVIALTFLVVPCTENGFSLHFLQSSAEPLVGHKRLLIP